MASDEMRMARDPLLENEMLRGIVKVLCSDLSPYGSLAFIRARDTVLNPEYRALLLEVLDA